jgi:hypothetical protein
VLDMTHPETRWLAAALLALMTAGRARPAWSGAAVANASGDVQVLNITANPPRTRQGITIDFNNFYGNVTGRSATPVRTVIIHWPHDMRWNGPRFPQCDPERLRSDGVAGCPEESIFANGTVEVDARPFFAEPLLGKITAFVGAPARGMSQVFLLELDRVPPVILVGEFSPDPQGEPYGFMQTFDLSTLPPVAVTNFDLLDVKRTIVEHSAGRRTVVPLTRAPRHCNGYWEYASTNVYASGDTLTATSRQPCAGKPDKASRDQPVGSR